MMRKIGKKANLWMLILLIITIHHKYSAHFEKVIDPGYSSQTNRMPGLEYQIPEPEYYNLDT